MGATDTHGALEAVDHWAATGLETRLAQACKEQQWPADAVAQLRAHYIGLTGLAPGSGPVWRGHGWRVWYGNNLWLDSRGTSWSAVPDDIVLGVSYKGYRRWMAHGVDPYRLGDDGMLYDARNCTMDEHGRHVPLVDTTRKWGVWVTDEVMQAIRWQAALAFIL